MSGEERDDLAFDDGDAEDLRIGVDEDDLRPLPAASPLPPTTDAVALWSFGTLWGKGEKITPAWRKRRNKDCRRMVAAMKLIDQLTPAGRRRVFDGVVSSMIEGSSRPASAASRWRAKLSEAMQASECAEVAPDAAAAVEAATSRAAELPLTRRRSLVMWLVDGLLGDREDTRRWLGALRLLLQDVEIVTFREW
jgi:hypothetical protein